MDQITEERYEKIKKGLLKLTQDVKISDKVYSFENYVHKKNKKKQKTSDYIFEKQTFLVKSKQEGGQIILTGKNNREYKLLLEYPYYKYLEPGDKIRCKLKRKLFYVYWEIDEFVDVYIV